MSALDDLRRSAAGGNAVVAAEPKRATGGFGQLIVGMIAGIAICLLARPAVDDYFHGRGGDQEQRQDQRDEKAEPVSGGLVVFVSDKQLPSVDQDLLMRKMPELSKARGMDFLWLDDSDSAAEKLVTYAQSKGVSLPMVGYVKDKSIKRVAKWPADEAALQSFLK